MEAKELKTRFDTLQEVYQIIEETCYNTYDEEEDLDNNPIAKEVLTRLTELIGDCVDEYHTLTGIALT